MTPPLPPYGSPDRDPEALAHPNMYLKRAQASAHTVRQWIHRNNPPPLEPEPDDVNWIMAVFDSLDRELARAVESADYRLPNASSPTPMQADREAANRRDVDLHRLHRVDDALRDILRWATSARWSTGVNAGDLDKVETMARNGKDNLRHLIAAAHDAALEQ